MTDTAERGGSRESKERAGWRPRETPRGSYEALLKQRRDIRWARFSWLTLRAVGESANDKIAHKIDDFVNARRNRWVAAQRHARVAPDLVVERPAGNQFSFLILGDPGEQDASQYAVVEPLLAEGMQTDFMVICSDVIYPAGDVNDYVNGFYLPYQRYPNTIYALPGNHDWYDGLNGFMYHFCGAEALPTVKYRLTDFNARQLTARWLWRKASRPRREQLLAWMKQRPPWKEEPLKPSRFARPPETSKPPEPPQPPQPGPYFAIDTGPLLIVAIDAGITGKLDGEQGYWLRSVSRHYEKPKVLLTGKPLIVDGRYEPGAIAWDSDHCPQGSPTVDDIVRDPAHRYVAAIGGDVHNYQRYSVLVPAAEEGDGPERSERRVPYIVSGGGGAFLSATHRIGLVDVQAHPESKSTASGFIPPVTERDFKHSYPLRGDSLAHFSKQFVPTVLQTFLWSILTLLTAVFGLGMLRWLEGDSLWNDWSAWDGVVLGLSGVTLLVGLSQLMLLGKRQRRGFLGWMLVTAALGALLWLVDDGSAWRWTAISYATAMLVTGSALFAMRTEPMARWVLALGGAAGIALLVVLDDTGNWRVALIALYTFVATVVLFRLSYVFRFEAQSAPAGIIGSIPGLAFIGGLALLFALGEPWWWKVSVVAVASMLGLAAFAVLFYLLFAVGVRRLLHPRNWQGRIRPDEGIKLIHEALLREAQAKGVAGPTAVERPAAAAAEPSPMERRIARVMTYTGGGLLRRLRDSGPLQRFLAELFDSDEPPFFKSFLRIDLDGDRLTINAYGVTGWLRDETSPSLEDSVVIDLKEVRELDEEDARAIDSPVTRLTSRGPAAR